MNDYIYLLLAIGSIVIGIASLIFWKRRQIVEEIKKNPFKYVLLCLIPVAAFAVISIILAIVFLNSNWN